MAFETLFNKKGLLNSFFRTFYFLVFIHAIPQKHTVNVRLIDFKAIFW
jgi:hypothetical protein